MKGTLKEKTCENFEMYVKKDSRLPQLLHNLQAAGVKTFLLTNSEWSYTNKLMEYLLDFEDAPYAGQNWRKYFDYTLVDARKPLFFGEGTVMRRVNIETGKLSIGHHIGNIETSAVYSGGNCDVFSKLIGTKGGNVLYVGDHIFGDVLKSKKLKGWKTFLIIPELKDELNVWTTKKDLYDKLQNFDVELADLYLHMDSSDKKRPDVKIAKECIRDTIHKMEMSYGTTGSLFRAGSRQTFFSSQMIRYADIYSGSALNLLFYPTFYMFRAPPMLLPHESTVKHDGRPVTEEPRRGVRLANMDMGSSIEGVNRGEEPGQSHDFDDDEETSERSNESSN
jgi:5'-nucleotidase